MMDVNEVKFRGMEIPTIFLVELSWIQDDWPFFYKAYFCI
jgi:hypothetical protein